MRSASRSDPSMSASLGALTLPLASTQSTATTATLGARTLMSVKSSLRTAEWPLAVWMRTVAVMRPGRRYQGGTRKLRVGLRISASSDAAPLKTPLAPAPRKAVSSSSHSSRQMCSATPTRAPSLRVGPVR